MRTSNRKAGLTVLALGAALLLGGCQPGADLPPLAEATQHGYRLGPGDEVRLITFGEEQLTGDFKVNDAGRLALPLLGAVPAAGQTTAELQRSIESELLAKKLFRDPSVSVEVSAYRPVFILGEVTRPGEYPYQPGMTVLSAVAIAGGFTYRAVEDYASIVRKVDDHASEGKVARSTLVSPGDVITVFERRF